MAVRAGMQLQSCLAALGTPCLAETELAQTMQESVWTVVQKTWQPVTVHLFASIASTQICCG